MRALPPTRCAARPAKAARQTEPLARKKAQRSGRWLDQQLSSARLETAKGNSQMVPAEYSRARKKQPTPVPPAQLKTAPGNNQQGHRVLPVGPESLPPASGSRRPVWRASGGAHRVPEQCREPRLGRRDAPRPARRLANEADPGRPNATDCDPD